MNARDALGESGRGASDDVDDERHPRPGLDVAEFLRRHHPNPTDVNRVVGPWEERHWYVSYVRSDATVANRPRC